MRNMKSIPLQLLHLKSKPNRKSRQQAPRGQCPPRLKGGEILEVGVQIKKYRNELGLSQEKLAEKVYVSRQTVSNWETGKNYPDIHSLLLLASLFGVSLDQLIKGGSL